MGKIMLFIVHVCFTEFWAIGSAHTFRTNDYKFGITFALFAVLELITSVYLSNGV